MQALSAYLTVIEDLWAFTRTDSVKKTLVFNQLTDSEHVATCTELAAFQSNVLWCSSRVLFHSFNLLLDRGTDCRHRGVTKNFARTRKLRDPAIQISTGAGKPFHHHSVGVISHATHPRSSLVHSRSPTRYRRKCWYRRIE